MMTTRGLTDDYRGGEGRVRLILKCRSINTLIKVLVREIPGEIPHGWFMYLRTKLGTHPKIGEPLWCVSWNAKSQNI